jgi:hypothetical protein
MNKIKERIDLQQFYRLEIKYFNKRKMDHGVQCKHLFKLVIKIKVQSMEE